MTRNQIEYQKYLETQRSNLAGETLRGKELEESRRHSTTMEEETAQHNRNTEATDRYKATSVDAHYTRMDDATLQQLAETIAHNKVNELQGEAKIRFEANYGFSKLRNDIYTALLRNGGTWQSVLGVAGASLDQILNGGVYDPFAEVSGVGDTRSEPSRSHYTVSLRGNGTAGSVSSSSSGKTQSSAQSAQTTRPASSLSASVKSGTNAVRDVMQHINDSLAAQTHGSQMEVRQTMHLSPYETQKAIEKAQKAAGRRPASKSTTTRSTTHAVDDLWRRHS